MNKHRLTLGSLFDGSGGFPLAGLLAGIEPVWASEIEPFPIRVTSKRLPQMRHYGDVSTLNGKEVEPVDIITFGSPCFPEGTLVLSENGYMPIENISTGMKVLTHRGRWREVIATGSKLSETIVLRGNHYGLECTPNHPIYSCDTKQIYSRSGNGRRINQTVLLPEKAWTPASEMKKKMWAVPNSIEGLSISPPVYSGSKKQKAMPQFSEALFYFVGRWLGDGWVCNSQRTGRPKGETHGTIFLCDSLDKLEELRSTVAPLSERYTVARDKSTARVSFVSQVFAQWLSTNFGQYAHGKTMPGWVFGLPESYRKAILQGLLDSDGYQINDCTWRISTVSKKLSESIRLLAEIQGYSTTVHLTKVSGTQTIEGREVHQRDCFSVVFAKAKKRHHLSDDLHGWYRVRSIQKSGQVKIVYNLTVADDNSYVADGIVVHNCQDMSVAGKRAGLNGERSGLFHEAIRIVKEMREATNGKQPRYIVWENVPGAFSSNHGQDFKAVLEAIIHVKEPRATVPPPDKGRWPYADLYLGEGWSVAYRVLDAQYWGVAQRRRRVFLVADFDSERAGDILFERKCKQRHTGAGEASRAGASGASADGAGETGCWCVNPQASSGITVTRDVAGTLVAQDHGHHPAVLAAGFIPGASMLTSTGIGYGAEVAPTLKADGDAAVVTVESQPPVAFGISGYNSLAWLSENPRAGVYEADTARTLDQSGGNPSAHQGGMAVVESFAMTTGSFMQAGREVSPPLMARDYKDPIVVNDTQYRVRRLTPTECGRLQGFPDGWCGGLETEDPNEEEINFWANVFETHRRVVTGAKKPKTRAQVIKWLRQPRTDGAEYRLWGNGVALPCVFFIMAGIANANGQP